MAYNKEDIFIQAKEAIANNNLFFIEDIVAWLPCDKTTFYRFFPPDCNEYNELKRMLDDNKIKTKAGIRAKLYKGKGCDLIALYKMIGTDEERRALSMTYQESKHKVDAQMIIVTADEMEKAALEKMGDEGERD